MYVHVIFSKHREYYTAYKMNHGFAIAGRHPAYNFQTTLPSRKEATFLSAARCVFLCTQSGRSRGSNITQHTLMNIYQTELQKLQYPIGKYITPAEYTAESMNQWMEVIRDTPEQLITLVAHLTYEQLSTPYRPGGWTLRQLVHHIADSHINAYSRFRFALTEDAPTIKPYAQEHWATLYDAEFGDIQLSLQLVTALHARWYLLVTHLTESQWNRTYIHPDFQEPIQLREALAMYAWHSLHHLQQLRNLIEHKQW